MAIQSDEPPIPSSNPGAGEPATDGGERDLSRQVDVAHTEYFRNLDTAWREAQQRCGDLHMEYHRSIASAAQRQDAAAGQAAHEKFQREYQAASVESDPAKAFADAYHKYRTAIQRALASANAVDLEAGTMMNLAQSLHIASSYAQMLQCVPAARASASSA